MYKKGQQYSLLCLKFEDDNDNYDNDCAADDNGINESKNGIKDDDFGDGDAANDDDDDFYRKSISKGIINSRT